ncbi:hypothetical protein DY000_02037414 [Brassica cretica]|uniref:DUF4005 domain-containing protein n=1 Tax=Brassica cretica TaxID=69181 RepID=A0ABQ7BB67_BRACR|nr:hypothetical protein DY000_02037414 [Brassica cretica]
MTKNKERRLGLQPAIQKNQYASHAQRLRTRSDRPTLSIHDQMYASDPSNRSPEQTDNRFRNSTVHKPSQSVKQSSNHLEPSCNYSGTVSAIEFLDPVRSHILSLSRLSSVHKLTSEQSPDLWTHTLCSLAWPNSEYYELNLFRTHGSHLDPYSCSLGSLPDPNQSPTTSDRHQLFSDLY